MKPRNVHKAMVMIMALFATLLVMPQQAQACTCTKLQGKYNKLSAKHAAAVAAGNPLKASILKSRIVNFVKNNWKEIPGCPPPMLPPGWCPDPDGGGGGGGGMAAFPGGRGHAGGAINLPGDTAFIQLFLRNADPSTGKTVTVRVKPDSLNPPVFGLLDSIFIVTLPPLPDTPGIIVPIPVEILPLSLVGDAGSFNVTVEESDGLFWNEPIVGSVTTSDVRVEPLSPIVEVPGSGGFTVGWRITNPGPGPITKSYSTFLLPDAEAFVTLNDGTPYPIFNSYPLDKTSTGGVVTIPGSGPSEAAGFVDVFCDMVSNELCEPTMLGCKGLEIDGGMSIVVTPNDANGLFDPPISSQGRDLVGSPLGGFVEVQIQDPPLFFPIQIPTFPGQPVEQILDQMAFEVHNFYLFQNDFAFQAATMDNFIDVFGPPGALIQYQSFDPGLLFEVPGCEPPGWSHPQILPGDIAQLQWIENNPPALQYDIIVTPLGGGPPLILGAPGGSNELLLPPLPVDEYTWQIQAICDFSGPIFSIPSFPDTFQIAPCNDGNPPINLSSTIGPSVVTLSWDPVQGTTVCQVQGTRVAPPGPTGKKNIAGIEPSSVNVPLAVLGPGTAWEWKVRCACNTDPVNATPFSATDNFGLPIVRLPAGIADMQVVPNPAQTHLQVNVDALLDREANLRIYDLLGRTALEHRAFLTKGHNVIEFDVASLSEGLYLLQLGEGEMRKIEIVR